MGFMPKCDLDFPPDHGAADGSRLQRVPPYELQSSPGRWRAVFSPPQFNIMAAVSEAQPQPRPALQHRTPFKYLYFMRFTEFVQSLRHPANINADTMHTGIATRLPP